MNATLETPRIVFLSDPRAQLASLTGGKASALAALTLQGHPVPDGFVVTTAAFHGDGVQTSRVPRCGRN